MRIWLSVIVLLLASSALAQPTVGVYFDEEGTQTSRLVATYPTNVSMYVVLKGLTEEVKSIELGLDYDVGPVHNVWPISFEFKVPGITNACSPDEFDWCLAIGPCLVNTGEPIVLAEIVIQPFFTITDYTICVTANSLVRGPHYIGCDAPGGETSTLYSAYQGCAVINPDQVEVPVGTAQSSFGRVKALYD